MQRLGSGLLLAVCVGVGSTAALGRIRVHDIGPPVAAAGAVALDGGRAAATGPTRVYADDHVLVSTHDPIDLAAVAAHHGARVLRGPGPSGYAALEVPAGMDHKALVRALRADPRVQDAGPDGIVKGTGEALRPSPKSRRARWHMVASNPPVDGDARGVTVALLDTGVAYEDRVENGTTWRRAPSLAGVRFVAPWDFINGDAHPNDDHQHGTHLASLVASAGTYPGIAPGVTVMPIKVLDHENVGTELALIDGIVHAVKNGADIINMSLSFGRGYVPSKALVDALEMAHDAGIVLVAAAGNDGGDYVSQPAANPLVIAVGANRPEGVDVYGAAPYSNASPRVDLMAPGGSVDMDRDEDGLLDGVIGETIALQDPTRTGFWLYAGT
ncbi:MAG: S8 family serine peptidase, partial [Myxococcota bacterium]